jgi:hypothetical protein
MGFTFPPQFPQIKIEKDNFSWWSVWINLPHIFIGTEYSIFDLKTVFKIDAPTGIEFNKTEEWHSFKITFLGFGFGYARQWGY